MIPRLPPEVASLLGFLQGSPDAVFVTDRQNRIVGWNPSAERLLGHAEGAALGESCFALLEGCDGWGNRYCTQTCPVKDMATRGEAVRRFELQLRTRDRGQVALEITILQIPAPAPDHFYLAHILQPSQRHAASRDEEAPGPRAGFTVARESPDARARKLTQREVEILGLMAAGRMTGEIASLLNLSTLTVRNHTQNILDKLEVHSKAEAVAFAFQKHLV